MLKKVFLLIAMLSFPLCSQSFSPILEFGVNHSWLKINPGISSDGFDTAFNPRFNMGFYHDFPLSNQLNLRTGLRYMQLGRKLDIDTYIPLCFPRPCDSARVEGTMLTKNHYITIPLKLFYSFSNTAFFMTIGTESGFLITSKISEHSTLFSFPPNVEEYERSTTKEMRKFHLALNIGIGMNLMLFSQSFYTHMQYSHGLTRVPREGIIPISDSSSVEHFDWRAREINFSIGYYFK